MSYLSADLNEIDIADWETYWSLQAGGLNKLPYKKENYINDVANLLKYLDQLNLCASDIIYRIEPSDAFKDKYHVYIRIRNGQEKKIKDALSFASVKWEAGFLGSADLWLNWNEYNE
jgi:hypothetical protein